MLTYAVLLTVLLWQWASVYRTDAPEYRPGAFRYLVGLVVSIVAVLASAGMEDAGRVAVWAAVVIGSIVLVVFYVLRTPDDSLGIRATGSMAERFGLFIIIVLGEVVLGVVDGLLAVGDLDFRTVATGVLGLSIAFGFWWTYFDYVGRRLPRQGWRLARAVALRPTPDRARGGGRGRRHGEPGRARRRRSHARALELAARRLGFCPAKPAYFAAAAEPG